MRILTQDKEAVRGINPRGWIKKTDSLEYKFQANLSAFSTQRADLMDVLESLRPEDWLRMLTDISLEGQSFERTVLHSDGVISTIKRYIHLNIHNGKTYSNISICSER